MYPAPGILERVGPDWDWIWLDGQHGQLGGYTEMLAMVRACHLIGRPAFVRVPSQEAGAIGLVLDMNVAGVIVPLVDSVAEARAVVRAAKFPPEGNRSYGGRRPIDFLGRSYHATANRDQKLICQIESDAALDAAGEIAALDGVDGLFLGPDDLMLRRGLSMEAPRDREEMKECLGRVVAACDRHGKAAFTVAVGDEMVALCAELGVRYMVCGGDVGFLASASREASARARAVAGTVVPPKPETSRVPSGETVY